MDEIDAPLIGVQARIEDAGVLADNGRYEGALLMLLVAVAATSRRRYPYGTPSEKKPGHRMSDREAFTTFLRAEIWRLVREHEDHIEYRGKRMPIEDFLYNYLRCHLVHEGRTPLDLYPVGDGDVFTIAYPNGTGISFPRLLLTRLNDVVWRAPENSYEATKQEIDAVRQRRARYQLPRSS